MLPFDKTEVITRQQKYDFDDYFGSQPAYYVRIETDRDCELYIYLMDGSNFKYNRGVRSFWPVELMNYNIKSIVIIPPTGVNTEVFIHATSQEQEVCTYETTD